MVHLEVDVDREYKYVFFTQFLNGKFDNNADCIENFVSTYCREVLCKRINVKYNYYVEKNIKVKYIVGCNKLHKDLTKQEARGLRSLFNRLYGSVVVKESLDTVSGIPWYSHEKIKFDGWFSVVEPELGKLPSGSFYAMYMYMLYRDEVLDLCLDFVKKHDYKVFNTSKEELLEFVYKVIAFILTDWDVIEPQIARVFMIYYLYYIANMGGKNAPNDADIQNVIKDKVTGPCDVGHYLLSTITYTHKESTDYKLMKSFTVRYKETVKDCAKNNILPQFMLNSLYD